MSGSDNGGIAGTGDRVAEFVCILLGERDAYSLIECPETAVCSEPAFPERLGSEVHPRCAVFAVLVIKDVSNGNVSLNSPCAFPEAMLNSIPPFEAFCGSHGLLHSPLDSIENLPLIDPRYATTWI